MYEINTNIKNKKVSISDIRILCINQKICDLCVEGEIHLPSQLS